MSSLQKSMLKSKLPPTGLKLGFTSGLVFFFFVKKILKMKILSLISKF